MKSVNARVIAHYVAAVLLAAFGYAGIPVICYSLWPHMPLLAGYVVNAVGQVFLFAVPALLILTAHKGLWQRFGQRLKKPTVDTVGFCMLGAVGATVVVSLIVVMWEPYAESIFGPTAESLPLPTPQNAAEWLLSLLCVAVIPAICEELFFRGLLQTALSARFQRAALWVVAIGFAALHGEIASFPSLVLVAWTLGMLLEKRGLIAGMIFHAVYNAVILVLSMAGSGVGLMGLMLSALAYVFSVRMLKKEEIENATDGTGL